jgi:PAP2 superfamily
VTRTGEAGCRPRQGSATPATRWPHRRPTAGTWGRLARELCLVGVFTVIYEQIRSHMVQAGGPALGHSLLIVSAERLLGLFHEQAVQAAFISSDPVTDGFNAYYGGTHFLVPAFVLAWLLFRHPAHYGRARTALAVITAAAFVCFWLFPVAPPRLLPARFGIQDMLVVPDGSGHFETSLITTAGDKYASMPSLHVAWAVWSALALYPVVRHWLLRALVTAYPLMTTLVVVATGNHFFLDALAGALLACATWAAVTRISTWLTVQTATRRLRHTPGPLLPAHGQPAHQGRKSRSSWRQSHPTRQPCPDGTKTPEGPAENAHARLPVLTCRHHNGEVSTGNTCSGPGPGASRRVSE